MGKGQTTGRGVLLWLTFDGLLEFDIYCFQLLQDSQTEVPNRKSDGIQRVKFWIKSTNRNAQMDMPICRKYETFTLPRYKHFWLPNWLSTLSVIDYPDRTRVTNIYTCFLSKEIFPTLSESLITIKRHCRYAAWACTWVG